MQELERLDNAAYKAADKLPLHVVLDDIRSLNNIGSIFRTADAFRLAHVHLCGITATPPHRDIQKTALGATESVEWSYHESALACCEDLKSAGLKIYALEQTTESTAISTFVPEPGRPMALVVGNEVKGVSDEVIALSDQCLEIVQYGTKHSLNVAVSTGMAIFHLSNKTRLASD